MGSLATNLFFFKISGAFFVLEYFSQNITLRLLLLYYCSRNIALRLIFLEYFSRNTHTPHGNKSNPQQDPLSNPPTANPISTRTITSSAQVPSVWDKEDIIGRGWLATMGVWMILV